MGIGFTYQSELFKNFRDIHNNDVYALIRFFERHEQEMNILNVEERFIVLCYYTNALFAAENYRKHLEYAKLLLERSIIEDIQFVDGFDVYLHTLQQKTCSHLALKEFDEAVNIAKQLLRLAPKDKKAKLLLRKVLLSRRPTWVLKAFAIAVAAGGLWTGIEILRLMVFEPFYPAVDQGLAILQIAALLAALGSLVLAFASQYFYVGREIRNNSTR